MSLSRTLSLIPAAALAVTLAACGDGGNASQPAPPPSSSTVDCSDRNLSQSEWMQHCSSANPAPNPSDQAQTRTLTEGSSVTYTARDTIEQSDTPTLKLTLNALEHHDHGYDGDPANQFTDTIKPDNGQYVALDITVKNVGNTKGTFLPQPYFVADDGKKTDTIQSSAVTVDGTDPDRADIANQQLAPGEYAEGVWLLDVPNTSGKVIIPEFGAPAVEIPIDPLS